MKNTVKINFKSFLIYFFLTSLFINVASCKKGVEIPSPTTSINSSNVYKNDATACAVLTGIYISIANNYLDNTVALLSISSLGGLSSDELDLVQNNAELQNFYSNSLTPLNSLNWSELYNTLFNANSAIEGLTNSSTLNPQVKQQLLGEAKFIRAFCFFYLVNLYGDVPLTITTDYKVNSSLSRSDKTIVYGQIIQDLKEAISQLNQNYVGSDGVTPSLERTRPNKGAAIALLARAYLFSKDYTNAEIESTLLIDNFKQYKLVELNSVFLKNSDEAIWQLQPVGVDADGNTKEGQFFVPTDNNYTSVATYLTTSLIDSFDPKDQRKSQWINKISDGSNYYYFPYKYKIGYTTNSYDEYSMVFRLAEQYLIRAEARIQQNKIQEGVSDLNIIRMRATDSSAPIGSRFSQLSNSLEKQDALLAVELERRHELFTEWGHRWLDLKRTNRANAILGLLKGNNWQSNDQLYPIPQRDIDYNPNLRNQQNPGY